MATNNYIDLPVEGGGSGAGVTSLNTQTGALTLVAGSNITITPGSGTLTIASTGSGGITSINSDSTAAQLLTVGTSGTNFAIVDAGSGSHVFNLPTASASNRGALSSADWSTFNGKQASGNYITALTGDATASGPGSAALTLATINSNVGSFGTASAVGTFTVNAKGLITAASSTSIQIAESQVTNLVSDLAGKQATGNYITALTGDATASGPGSVALTLATVNSNVGSFGNASSVSAITVNAKGLVTAAASTSIQIAESQVTNLVSDLAGKQATGNYITALTSDITAAGPGSAAATIAVGAVTDTKGSLANKPPVTVVSTANLTLSGAQTIDGQLTVAGTSIVLATAQTAPAENGPWTVQSGAWTRPTWYPAGGTTQSFQFITALVRLGTVYQGTIWRQTAAAPITINTTATTWVVTPLALNSNTLVGTVPVANGGTNSASALANGKTMISSGGAIIEGATTANLNKRSFGTSYSNSTGITTGNTVYITIPNTGTISKWTILSSVSASAVIDIWKTTFAGGLPTISNTIVASAAPTLTSATKANSTTLTGWTTSITAGDIIAFNITSVTSAVYLNIVIEMDLT